MLERARQEATAHPRAQPVQHNDVLRSRLWPLEHCAAALPGASLCGVAPQWVQLRLQAPLLSMVTTWTDDQKLSMLWLDASRSALGAGPSAQLAWFKPLLLLSEGNPMKYRDIAGAAIKSICRCGGGVHRGRKVIF